MRRFTFFAAIFFLLALKACGQSGFTTVQAQVLDPSGTPYAACTGNANFVPSPSATQIPTIGGSAFPTVAVIAQCDAFGKLHAYDCRQ